MATIRAAKVRLEERAKSQAEARAAQVSPEAVQERVAVAQPRPKEQSNFTDTDSRIMKSKSGWIQGCNSQLMANEQGIIMAEVVSNHSGDSTQLTTIVAATETILAAIGVPVARRRPPRVFQCGCGVL